MIELDYECVFVVNVLPKLVAWCTYATTIFEHGFQYVVLITCELKNVNVMGKD